MTIEQIIPLGVAGVILLFGVVLGGVALLTRSSGK
jgi:hypothetical protein